MLMIGATGRNTGKTELACRVIRSHAAQVPIAALKVTTVVRTDGTCPRGGAGCGVCSSLGEPWCVTRELDTDSGKDTSRLLGSGAREAWWLRVREESLRDGACGLLEHVPAGWVSVCESNSLSRVVEPGLFLQVRSASEGSVKTSARAVADLADRVVVSDGATFDLDLARISLLDGQWALQRDACAVVIDESEPLAASLRAQFTQVESAAAPSGTDDDRHLLRALVEALPRSNHDWCLVASARGGSIPAGLVNAMFRRREGADAVVARGSSGAPASLVGIFHCGLLPRVVAALDGNASRAPNLAALGRVRELVVEPASAGTSR
jgi:molybdopterin-guanine dinucleotide biosynthesis protein A